MDTDTGLDADLRELFSSPRKVTILQQILGSQTGALSAVELAARNNIAESTVRGHLSDLADRDSPIVVGLDATVSDVPAEMPRVYFAVTEYGIDLLKRAGVYEAVGLVYNIYEAADLEIPDAEDRSVTLNDIESFDGRPSPEWL